MRVGGEKWWIKGVKKEKNDRRKTIKAREKKKSADKEVREGDGEEKERGDTMCRVDGEDRRKQKARKEKDGVEVQGDASEKQNKEQDGGWKWGMKQKRPTNMLKEATWPSS